MAKRKSSKPSDQPELELPLGDDVPTLPAAPAPSDSSPVAADEGADLKAAKSSKEAPL